MVRDAFAQVRGTGPDGDWLGVVAVAIRTMVASSTRHACAWVLDWQKRRLEEPERSDRRCFVETLCRLEPSIAAARSLALRFVGLVRNRELDGFDRWLRQMRA